jgi:ferrous iron transport protein B
VLTHLRRPAAPESERDLPVVALVGRPNVGKSTLFGAATGRFAEAANAPGTTVATERRLIDLPDGTACLADLPGTLSLEDSPARGEPFWRDLLAVRPDAILVVGDAGDLARHLPLALACRDLGLPIVFAANLADEAAARGIEVDTGRLSQLLASPVFLTTGRTGRGVVEAVAAAVGRARQRRAVRAGGAPRGTVPARVYDPRLELQLDQLARTAVSGHSLGAAALDAIGWGLGPLVEDGVVSARGAASIKLGSALESARWRVAAGWAAQVERRSDVGIRFEDRLAVWSTSLWPGLPIFTAVTALVFAAMMVVGGTLSTLLGDAWTATVSPVLGSAVQALIPQPVLAAGLLWGLDGGMLALLTVGIPYILTFYVLLAVLEDSGYLTSAAVLTDRLFNTLGLPGRVAIPLLAASGCNVPAIYGTRVLPTRRERLLGAFLVTMTPCSARSAVVVAAVAPFAGPVAAIGAFGLIAAITFASGLAANAIVPGRQPALVLELAPLRRPILRQVARKAWRRFSEFVRAAAPIMLAGSIVLGLFYESGLVWSVTPLLDPVVGGWLGLPSVAGLALLFAFLRKELALQLLVALAVVQLGAGAASLGQIMSPAQLFVYAVVTSVSVPCVATLAALRGEFGWRPALAMSGASLGIALAAGGLLARLLGTV